MDQEQDNKSIIKFGEACYELNDHPSFEVIIELENKVKSELVEELLRMDAKEFSDHGQMLAGIIKGINKMQDLRQTYMKMYIDDILPQKEKE